MSATSIATSGGRPMLRPGCLVLRRATRAELVTLQVGLAPDHAVLLEVSASSCGPVLAALDGTRTADQVVAAAVRDGADRPVAEALLARLDTAGVLIDADAWRTWTRQWVGAERNRRMPDLAAWEAHSGARAVMNTRAATTVRVRSAGRVGAALALLLAAGGIGRLEVIDRELVGAADITPFGFRPAQVGLPRPIAVRDLVAELGSGTKVAGKPRHADLVVLCSDSLEPDREEIAGLVRASVPHLLVRARETTGSVGPLVVPGRTACVRCTDLYRTDRDAGWPAVLAQLTTTPSAPDTVLGARLAALAAAQVFGWLAGTDPGSIGRTIELELATGPGRTRQWQPHPCCGCRWPNQIATEAG